MLLVLQFVALFTREFLVVKAVVNLH